MYKFVNCCVCYCIMFIYVWEGQFRHSSLFSGCNTIQLLINFALHEVPIYFVVVAKMMKWFVSMSRLLKVSFIPFLISTVIQSATPVSCLVVCSEGIEITGV
jgi:hypothetical protein